MCAQRLPAGACFALVWAVFYRLCVAAIVGFWLWMAALLARSVWFQGDTRPRPVPLEYVGHLVFRHEMASDLVLYRQRRRADGTVHFQPKRLADGNLMSASGNFFLGLPGVAGQRVVFHLALELNPGDQVRRAQLSVSVHEAKGTAPGVTLHLDGQPAENRWHYQFLRAGTTLREGDGTPAELLAALEPSAYGLDAGILPQAISRQGAVTVTAARGTLHVNDDNLDTYVVTIRQGEGLETTVHVNQVGQVVAAKTFLGFDLYDETISP